MLKTWQEWKERIRSIGRHTEREVIAHKFLLWEQYLIHLPSGKKIHLQVSEQEQDTWINAEVLATAAKALCQQEDKKPLQKRVILLLPPFEFIATEYDLPEMAKKNLYGALQLQAGHLLPAVDEPLLLSVSSHQASAIAFWMRVQRADALFKAFFAKGIFLAAIAPRTALLQNKVKNGVVSEQDNDYLTYLHLQDGEITQWQQISSLDLDDKVLLADWEQQQANLQEQVTAFKQLEDWLTLADTSVKDEYCFYPQATQHLLQQQKKQQQKRWLITAAIGIVVIACLPYLKIHYHQMNMRRAIADFEQQTAHVRQLRSQIQDIEENWGTVYDFPQIKVLELLRILNKEVPKNSWITTLKVDNGIVDIQGNSPNPSGLLERLSNVTRFSSVEFKGAVNQNRFDIHFILRDVDVPSYLEKYFPTDVY